MNTDLSALCTHVLGLSCDGHGLDGEEKLVKLRNIQPPPQDGLCGHSENEHQHMHTLFLYWGVGVGG